MVSFWEGEGEYSAHHNLFCFLQGFIFILCAKQGAQSQHLQKFWHNPAWLYLLNCIFSNKQKEKSKSLLLSRGLICQWLTLFPKSVMFYWECLAYDCSRVFVFSPFLYYLLRFWSYIKVFDPLEMDFCLGWDLNRSVSFTYVWKASNPAASLSPEGRSELNLSGKR